MNIEWRQQPEGGGGHFLVIEIHVRSRKKVFNGRYLQKRYSVDMAQKTAFFSQCLMKMYILALVPVLKILRFLATPQRTLTQAAVKSILKVVITKCRQIKESTYSFFFLFLFLFYYRFNQTFVIIQQILIEKSIVEFFSNFFSPWKDH